MTTGPVAAPGDVEARLAEALCRDLPCINWDSEVEGGCSQCESAVQEIIAPIVADEVARAVEAAVVRVEGERNRDWQEHLRLHPLSNSKSCPYDYGKHDAYARAARLVREAKR